MNIFANIINIAFSGAKVVIFSQFSRKIGPKNTLFYLQCPKNVKH